MKVSHKILLLSVLTLSRLGWSEEVLPSLSEEKMTEYKNAFGKAISDTRNVGQKISAPSTVRDQSGLSNVTKQLRDNLDKNDPKPAGNSAGPGPTPPGPGNGPGGNFPPGPPKGFPGAPNGGLPPPGFGSPGQPGGPPPPPNGHNGPPPGGPGH